MAYGHAERTLAAIKLLQSETIEFLRSQQHLDPEQQQWLRDAAESASRRLQPAQRCAPGRTAGPDSTGPGHPGLERTER